MRDCTRPKTHDLQKMLLFSAGALRAGIFKQIQLEIVPLDLIISISFVILVVQILSLATYYVLIDDFNKLAG
jgi:hypothetical protein